MLEDIANRLSGLSYCKNSPFTCRQLGKEGPFMPILGMGGEAIFSKGTEKEAQKVFEQAIESGIRFIDTAHDYKHSQKRLGKFFKTTDIELFIATKTVQRKRDDFLREAKENIDLLGRIPDVLYIHSVRKGEMIDEAIEALREAKSLGLCRYVGLTSHDDPNTAWEAVRWNPGFFDITMVALNPADMRFMEHYIPYCQSQGIAVVAMKVMGKGRLIRANGPGVRNGKQALRFALSKNSRAKPVDLAVVGFSNTNDIDDLVPVVTNFEPYKEWQCHDLIMGTSSYAEDIWWYRGDLGDWDVTLDTPLKYEWPK